MLSMNTLRGGKGSFSSLESTRNPGLKLFAGICQNPRLVLRTNWQGELKDRASWRICLRPQPPSMSLDNRTADGQSHAQSLRLGRIKGIKESINLKLRIQSRARISY